MKYRAEIDGLRAWAVLPVILFHAGFDLFKGGYVGVDIFFVISGYLITTILVEDIEKERFSIAHFYERRARRILPALTLVILACVPAAWALMLPGQLDDFAQSIVAASLFVSNILFWMEADYFDTAVEEKPLLHTWSLAVEEQYYVFFPIFLFLAWRFGRNRVFWMIAVSAFASLLLSEYLSRTDSATNFYLAPSRVWELFAGSLAAFSVRKHGVRANDFLAMLGLLMVAASIFLFDSETPFPSFYALLPIVGVVLLVMFAHQETWAARILSNKAFVWVGLISYSAYLWHQPLFAFARIVSVEELSVAVALGLSGLSLALAWVSWKFIEAPFRDRNFMTRNQVLAVSAATIVATVALGGVLYLASGKIGAGAFNPLNRPLVIGNYVNDNQLLRDESWQLLKDRTGTANYYVEGNASDRQRWFSDDDTRRKVVVVGNSHGKDIYNVLSFSRDVARTYQLARYGEQVANLSAENAFFSSPNYTEADVVVLATRLRERDLPRLDEAVSIMVGSGKKVVIVENLHEFDEFRSGGWTLADRLVFSLKDTGSSIEDIARQINHAYYENAMRPPPEQVSRYNAEFRRIASKYPEVILLDRMDYICKPENEICFGVAPDLTKYFYDYGHHTAEGAKFFGKRVDEVDWFAF